jgi:CoA:oxalate CoA-transferase
LSAGPLKGITVVELGSAIAAPMCGMLLGDMGAEVIKIESPGKGDESRHWGELVQGQSPFFLQYNRNKRSLTLNLRTAAGRAILLKLLAGADVLLENFRPGTMAKMGASYEQVSVMNPRLIYCSISGFGQTGPYSRLGGYDAIIQAMSGVMSVNGEPGGTPLRVGLPITDILAAQSAAYAVALAIVARERTGRGQELDVSLFESGLTAVAQWVTISKLTGKPTRRFGNKYPILAPYEPFPTKDQPIMVAVANEALWRTFCRTIGREELVEDPRFRTNALRTIPENRESLAREVEATFRDRTAGEWIEALWGAGVPAGPINGVEYLPKDPQLVARGAFATVSNPVVGDVDIVAAMPKLSGTPGGVHRPPPTLGQHSSELLAELGLSAEEIARLRSENVV